MQKVKYEKHGYATGGISKDYRNWYKMISRCHNEKDPDYSYYGGRGIKVCLRWRKSILNFIEDMGERKTDLTLDRINNNKGYSKSNCRWATRKEQFLNRRPAKNVPYITFKGKTKSVKEWSTITGIKYITLYNRLKLYRTDISRIFSKESVSHLSKRINYAKKRSGI